MISHGVRRRLHDESRALRDWRRGFGRVIRRIARFDGEPKQAASDPPRNEVDATGVAMLRGTKAPVVL